MSTYIRIGKLNEVMVLWNVTDVPNCVRIFSSWEQNGFLYILTEYCENGRYIYTHKL